MPWTDRKNCASDCNSKSPPSACAWRGKSFRRCRNGRRPERACRIMRACCPEAAVDRHARVEHEAVSLVAQTADLLEIVEDASVELEHVGDAFGLQPQGRFLAADAAGAKTDDGGVLQL